MLITKIYKQEIKAFWGIESEINDCFDTANEKKESIDEIEITFYE